MIGQADKRSRRYIRRLANRLMPLVYGMKLALPPGESRYGAAQANADGDDPWTAFRKWLHPLLDETLRPPGDGIEPLLSVLQMELEGLDCELPRVSIAALLRHGWMHEGKLIVERKMADRGISSCRRLAAELGFRLMGGRLMMALGCKPLKEPAKESDYPDADLDDLALRIPGANRYSEKSKNDDRGRASFAGKLYRAVIIPRNVVRELEVFRLSDLELGL